MPAKKRFFTHTKKPKIASKEGIGNKSVNIRGKKSEKEVVLEKAEQIIQEKIELPKNPQTITEEKKPSFTHWLGLEVGLFVLLLTISAGFLLYGEVVSLKKIVEKRANLEQELNAWEHIARQYPTYRDANFQVAILAYQLKNTNLEREYTEKTLAIDPNFEPAQKLLGME